MTSTKYKLGELIEQLDGRNVDGKFKVDDVRGISTSKEFITTKADMDGVSLTSYKVVGAGEFAFVPDTSRRGDKMSLAYNNSSSSYIVSSISCVFKVNNQEKLLPDYLYIYFNRPEFDRYARFNSWGSARETFAWEDMCDIEIDLPPIEIQKKYVDIYNAMITNQACYECGLEDLKLTCFAYIERLRKTEHLSPIGNYIEPFNEKNTDGSITLEQGVDINKQFITPQRGNSNLSGRKIVRHGQFAYCTQLNNENVAIAYRSGDDCVVSSVYDVFGIAKKEELLPEYLMLWLIRPEFGRFVYWASEGSAYEFLNYDNLANYKIPIPPMRIQKAIGDIFNVYSSRKTMNERLKNQIKNICPILIKGSLGEANK